MKKLTVFITLLFSVTSMAAQYKCTTEMMDNNSYAVINVDGDNSYVADYVNNVKTEVTPAIEAVANVVEFEMSTPNGWNLEVTADLNENTMTFIMDGIPAQTMPMNCNKISE